MSTVMITGANRGLGLEFARQYAADGWHVIATCRRPDEAAQLNAIENCDVYGVDVTDFEAVTNLAQHLDGTAIDVLINNAGVYGPNGDMLNNVNFDAWPDVLKTNAMAPLHMSQCFIPHVAKGEHKCIAALSSKMGSMTDNTSGGSYIYRSSKAALNAVFKSLSHDLSEFGINAIILHPGWVRTDMGGPNGLIDAPESVSGLRQVIAKVSPENSGCFFNYDGTLIDW